MLYKEGFDKKSDAQAFEREFLLKNSRNCEMSFASLVELYRADAEHRVREGTQGTQDSIIDKWLLPYFGELPVNEIDAVTIRNWQNTVMSAINPRTGKKYSETYIRSLNSRLSAIFNYAVKFYNLKSNPCHPAGFMGKKKAGKMKFWTLSEFNQAMAYVTNWSFRVAFMLMYWLGLREGECLALQPADILPSKIARIEKTHHRRKGPGKIYVDSKLIEHHRRRHTPQRSCFFVCPRVIDYTPARLSVKGQALTGR